MAFPGLAAWGGSPECVSPPEARAKRCGKRLASGSEDGTLRLWDTLEGLLDKSDRLIQRDPPILTPDELARYGFDGRGKAH